MMRTLTTGIGIAVCGLLLAGCDTATSAGKKAEEGGKKAVEKVKEATKEGVKQAKEATKEAVREAKEGAKEAVDAAKVAVLKPIEEALPKIEDKIKGMSGDAATKAKQKFEEFKKLLEQFKESAPDKWQSLKDGLAKAFDELKKLVGVDK